jgi:hypothetical protein
VNTTRPVLTLSERPHDVGDRRGSRTPLLDRLAERNDTPAEPERIPEWMRRRELARAEARRTHGTDHVADRPLVA